MSSWIVVRSSETILARLDTLVPSLLFRPTMLVRRRVRGRRSWALVRLQQYPGYAFARPSSAARLWSLQGRAPHSVMLGADGCPLLVPDEQLDYARQIEAETASTTPEPPETALPVLSPGQSVTINSGPLAGVLCVVASVTGERASLTSPLLRFPVLVSLSSLSPSA